MAGPYHTVIIGCGMAGLAAGIRLALFGHRVLIVERHNAPGGLNSFYFKDGHRHDVGLHAVTNFVPAGIKGTPLGKLLRQLRLKREDFELSPQLGSRIAFPGVDLRFGNGIGLLESEVARAFPGQIDAFRRLREAVLAWNEFDYAAQPTSARAAVAGFISDPLLVEMLFCPLMYYGSARENDMDFDQFVIMWKALFEEGFARPAAGVRVIIRALLDQYRQLGGERRMRCGVRSLRTDGSRVSGVELDSGEVIEARHVLSTAGKVETFRLCGSAAPEPLRAAAAVGRLSYVETISILDRPAAQVGWDETIVFFNDSPRFAYERPGDLLDTRSGVICFPGNYAYPVGVAAPEPMLRVTALAEHDRWVGLDPESYAAAKESAYLALQRAARRFLPTPAEEPGVIARDLFTPRTIVKFTGHLGGAIYGAPEKVKDGRTPFSNLYLAGTDQGFLGIVGAMLSGISMANLHLLQAE